MARVSRGVTARARHKKVFKKTKGHYGRRKNVFRVAVQSMENRQRGRQVCVQQRARVLESGT